MDAGEDDADAAPDNAGEPIRPDNATGEGSGDEGDEDVNAVSLQPFGFLPVLGHKHLPPSLRATIP